MGAGGLIPYLSLFAVGVGVAEVREYLLRVGTLILFLVLLHQIDERVTHVQRRIKPLLLQVKQITSNVPFVLWLLREHLVKLLSGLTELTPPVVGVLLEVSIFDLLNDGCTVCGVRGGGHCLRSWC